MTLVVEAFEMKDDTGCSGCKDSGWFSLTYCAPELKAQYSTVFNFLIDMPTNSG